MGWVLVFALVAVASVFVGLAIRGRRVATVYAPNVILLYRDGAFVRELGAGRHIFYDWQERLRLVPVSKIESPVQMGELTVMSQDQFSFRIGLSPVISIIDAQTYQESVGIHDATQANIYFGLSVGHPALHGSVSAAAVEAVGRLKLTDVIANPAAVASDIQDLLSDAIPGASVAKILVTSINLPPEIRKMFTDVERAKMEALAGLERARGEHASLRVLANAARLAKDNPELANLRLLQTIETSKGPTTIILGNPAGLPTMTAKA